MYEYLPLIKLKIIKSNEQAGNENCILIKNRKGACSLARLNIYRTDNSYDHFCIKMLTNKIHY